jgi:single-stranded DNA-specific DHH superfamily exonuclease
VIFRYTAGLNAGWENKNWVVDGFIIRKPENQLSTKVDVKIDTSSTQQVVNAYITPEFYYHDLYGGNIKYRNADIEMHISGIAVRPNTFPDGSEQATKFTEIKTKKNREDYLGGGISKSNDRYSMGFNYVARLSPFDRDRDSLVEDPRWNQAVNGFVARNLSEYFRVSADVKYDMLTTDRLVMVRAGYKVSQDLMTSLGMNLIGTPSSGKSYWSPYSNNDALFASLRYTY